MIGLFIVQPKKAHKPRIDRDFGIILQDWALLPNNAIPNTMAMEFNWLTINGKAGPRPAPPLVAGAAFPLIVSQLNSIAIVFGMSLFGSNAHSCRMMHGRSLYQRAAGAPFWDE